MLGKVVYNFPLLVQSNEVAHSLETEYLTARFYNTISTPKISRFIFWAFCLTYSSMSKGIKQIHLTDSMLKGKNNRKIIKKILYSCGSQYGQNQIPCLKPIWSQLVTFSASEQK
jgi:hypothetical protein